MARRIFEIAKDLGIESKLIVAKCQAEGIPESVVKNHMSPVSIGLEATIREWFSNALEQRPVTSEQWHTTVDLPPKWQSLADPTLPAMIELWRERHKELRDGQALDEFVRRLRRQWAIETGILERLYTLSDSATRALVERGLDAALITHDDTDKSPELVVATIRDQEIAIEGLYQLTSKQQQLTPFVIRQLHQIITKHQPFSETVDPNGRVTQTPMTHGEWKRRSNRVERSDGTRLDFCPPEHVQTEIDRLLNLHRQHTYLNVPAEIEAAWLHHRFTLIHPFDDGNGRIARCLATLVMLQAGWFPLVITRHDRDNYIAALRSADRGDLAPLVATFADLQKRALRQALDLGNEVVRSHAELKGTLNSIKRLFTHKSEQLAAMKERSFGVADALYEIVRSTMQDISKQVTTTLREVNKKYWAPFSGAARSDTKAQYNTLQVKEAAKRFQYFADTATYHAWGKIDLRAAGRWEILISVHASGRDSRGFFAVCGVIYQRVQRQDDDEGTRISAIVPLSSEPFEFTYLDDPVDVERRFSTWLNAAIQTGLEIWQSNV